MWRLRFLRKEVFYMSKCFAGNEVFSAWTERKETGVHCIEYKNIRMAYGEKVIIENFNLGGGKGRVCDHHRLFRMWEDHDLKDGQRSGPAGERGGFSLTAAQSGRWI